MKKIDKKIKICERIRDDDGLKQVITQMFFENPGYKYVRLRLNIFDIVTAGLTNSIKKPERSVHIYRTLHESAVYDKMIDYLIHLKRQKDYDI